MIVGADGLDGCKILLEVEHDNQTLTVYRPDRQMLEKTREKAKEIFVEAFSTTYTGYYKESKAVEPIEKWLRLREGLTLATWLSATFDDEYMEYQEGKKQFVYLCDSSQHLLGWLSHSLVAPDGDLYLSQCSLEADSRNQKLTTTTFKKVLEKGVIKQIFPGIKQVKLIARKINTIADRLYVHSGFTKDEKIDPSVYGESYDDRYVGYRMSIS